MESHLRFEYDREGDTLAISTRTPYAEQESEEIGDGVIARLNPDTGEVEHVEVPFFSTRLHDGALLDLPIAADRRLVTAS